MGNFRITKTSNQKTPLLYSCNICYYNTVKKANFERHIQSKRHRSKEVDTFETKFDTFETKFDTFETKFDTFETQDEEEKNEKIIKKPKDYRCQFCNYKTEISSNFNKHLKTESHINIVENYLKTNNKISKCEKCGKEYKFASGLSKHKKKCNSIETIITKNFDCINKKIDTIASKPFTINNTTNNTVNIETFLNNECSEAMDFLDFIRSITITYDDVVKMGKKGFIESYNELIINKIKDMDITMRPAHCTNKRQMYFFIKHKKIWTNDKDHKLLNSSINILKDKECEAWYNHSMTTRDRYETDKEVNERADAMNEIAKMNDDRRFVKIIKKASDKLYLNKNSIY
jgi:hypothetical protein